MQNVDVSTGEVFLQSLIELFYAAWNLVVAFGAILLPWIPLVIWIAFWLYAVDWQTLYPIIWKRGGWAGLLFLCLIAILVWGVVAPPDAGAHHFPGLTLSNFVGKTVFVTALACIALICGAVQLGGFVPRPKYDAPEPAGHGSH